MRKYKVHVIQKESHSDFLNHLISALTSIDGCVEIFNTPKQKSVRNIPEPGIKWVDGIIYLKDEERCIKAMQETIVNRSHEYFNIRLKRFFN